MDLGARMLEEVVRSHVGRSADVQRVLRNFHTPMSVVTEEAVSDMLSDVAVFWVDGGLPEMFSMPQLQPPVVIFSSRFLEVSCFVRQLVIDEALSDQTLTEASERMCLRVMAELALRYEDPALAAYLISRALTGQTIFYNTGDSLISLEAEERNESYMAVWFFGLLHEIGHIAVTSSHSSLLAEIPSNDIDEDIEQHLAGAPGFSGIPRSLFFPEGGADPSHPLNAKHLSTEIACDIFATRKLIAATARIAYEDARPGIDPQLFSQEVLVMLNVLAIMEICHRTVRNASTFHRNSAEAWAGMLTPIALGVRATMLSREMAYLFGGTMPRLSSEAAFEAWMDFFVRWNGYMEVRLAQIETGLARAMRQVLFPAERELGMSIKLGASLKSRSGVVSRMELNYFCRLADELRVMHPDIEHLRRIADGSSLWAE